MRKLPLALPPALIAALKATFRPALPTLAAGVLAGLYVILMLAAGNRDTQLFGYAVALGLAVLLPFEATAFWLRRGAPLPHLPPLPAGIRLPFRTARQPEPARVVPAE